MKQYSLQLGLIFLLLPLTTCSFFDRVDKPQVPLDQLSVQMEAFIKEEAELNDIHLQFASSPPFEIIGQAPEDKEGRRKLAALIIWEQSMYGNDAFAHKDLDNLKKGARGNDELLKMWLDDIEASIDSLFLPLPPIPVSFEGLPEFFKYNPQFGKWVGKPLLDKDDWVVKIRFAHNLGGETVIFTTFAILTNNGEVKFEPYSMLPPEDRWGH